MAEVATLIEFIHHLIGIQKLKRHMVINMLGYLFVLFGVIEFNRKVRNNIFAGILTAFPPF